METLQCCEINEKQSLSICCLLSILCGVTTYPTCTPCLCAPHRFWCCPTLWPPSGRPLAGNVVGHCGFHYKGTDIRTRTSGKMPGCKLAHSIIPKGFTYSATWCGVRQASITVKKVTASNELTRHRHISYLVELWRICAQRKCISQ